MSQNKFILLFLLAAALLLVFLLTFNIRKKSDTDLKRQIGQMLIVGFRGCEVSENSYIIKAVRNLNLGGIVLFDMDGPTKSFPRNIQSPRQLKELIRDLQKSAPVPLFISLDAEGGRVNRLKPKYGFIAVPGHQELGEKNDVRETHHVSAQLARELAGLGFNLDFAPSVDVNANPYNPVIGALGRSFSADEKVVLAQAKAFIAGLHEQGVLTAIKHFPGHGSSNADSHKGFVDVTDTYQDRELLPFKELIKDGVVDMVMTAHIMNKKIDADYPATLSGRFINNILRKELGFKGVVVSDDMQMGAITQRYGFKEALIRAVNAGCDMLIVSNNGSVYNEKAPYEAVAIIAAAVKSGEIPMQRIMDSNQRIETLKKALKNGR